MRDRMMPRLYAVALLAAAVVVVPGSALSAGPVVAVGQGGDRFSPSSVAVPIGGAVTWRWAEGGHNVHVRSSVEGFDSGYKRAGGTYSHTFTHAGVYTFTCDAHQPEMRGTVTVGGAHPRSTVHRAHGHRRHHARHRRPEGSDADEADD